MNKRTLVVDQLYNLAAGFLYALSICYFARGSDFAPGGISGLPSSSTTCGTCPWASPRWCSTCLSWP